MERAPTSFDLPVCRECKQPIPTGAPKVPARGGWICQACAYAAERMP